ncbi:MAG TPA: hypothetical protein VJS12_03165 [Steroidobacteraceae bacterium]|nr:hypothetical protein [Steroidobacteraceae bacterium]
MSAPLADSVMAATYKLVQQAMTGQWQEVPKTVQERRDLLNQISSNARPQDQEWLSALKQAMNESDAAVKKMAAVAGPHPNPPPQAGEGNDVAVIMDMLGKGG